MFSEYFLKKKVRKFPSSPYFNLSQLNNFLALQIFYRLRKKYLCSNNFSRGHFYWKKLVLKLTKPMISCKNAKTNLRHVHENPNKHFRPSSNWH